MLQKMCALLKTKIDLAYCAVQRSAPIRENCNVVIFL